ncbi:MAG: PAS domain S-box protein [Desulfovibrionaceae bacterium]|nr:PAS domain S-box protein [Desulfovibrionaceae bacterium]
MTTKLSYEELRQRATEHARLAERKQRILDLSPAIIYTCSIGETYPATFISKNVKSVLGYKPLDFTSNPNFWAEHIHPEDHERVFAELPSLFEHGRHIHEYRFLAKDGNYRWIRDELNLIVDDQGNEQEIIGYLIDITENKRLEKKLRESETRLSLLVQQSPMGIVTWDTEFRVVDWNKASEKIFGYSREEATGKHAEFIVPMESREPVDQIWQNLLELRGGKRSTNENITKDGETILCEWFNAPVVNDRNEVINVLSLVQNITEQKNIEKQLQQAQKMEAIGTLAGGIAHDFNNILSVIIGFAEMAKIQIEAGEKPLEDLNQISTAGKRAAKLVEQILAFSRQTDHQSKPLYPHLIIKESMKMLRSSLPTTVSLQEEIDSQCGAIMADSTNIHQIVMNLCTNALHALENEKGRISIKLCREEVQAADINESDVSPGEFIVLSVTDSGVGIDKAILDQIFDPYFTTKEKGKGTGLGLAVIYGIVKDYKGFIRVESILNEGTTFHVYFPALKNNKASHAEVEAAILMPRGSERIMVVDDEKGIVSLSIETLTHLGYTVTGITSSEEALEKINATPASFDLVITDQTMPNLAGVELAQEILKIRPDMPIMLCTGYSSVISEQDALAIGIKKYIRKPCSAVMLARNVREVLDNG